MIKSKLGDSLKQAVSDVLQVTRDRAYSLPLSNKNIAFIYINAVHAYRRSRQLHTQTQPTAGEYCTATAAEVLHRRRAQ